MSNRRNNRSINLIKGGVAKDNRGQIRFVNDFDMSVIKRFYIIKNSDTDFIRGWRAHRIEQRWFYVLQGRFEVSLIEIDNWDKPSTNLTLQKISISSEDMSVLHIPAGYATSIKACNADSELLVFADYGIEHAQMDDYTWNLEYFQK